MAAAARAGTPPSGGGISLGDPAAAAAPAAFKMTGATGAAAAAAAGAIDAAAGAADGPLVADGPAFSPAPPPAAAAAAFDGAMPPISAADACFPASIVAAPPAAGTSAAGGVVDAMASTRGHPPTAPGGVKNPAHREGCTPAPEHRNSEAGPPRSGAPSDPGTRREAVRRTHRVGSSTKPRSGKHRTPPAGPSHAGTPVPHAVDAAPPTVVCGQETHPGMKNER